MMADQNSDDQTVERRPANQNPWYILATWEGECEGRSIDEDDKLLKFNRTFWHRLMFNYMNDETKKYLLENEIESPPDKDTGFQSDPDFGPFSKGKLENIQNELPEKFKKRNPNVPVPDEISNFRDLVELGKNLDFKNLEFNKIVSFEYYCFPVSTDFSGSIFSNLVKFFGTLFQREVYFNRVKFESSTFFRNSSFKGKAEFCYTHFTGNVYFKGSIFYFKLSKGLAAPFFEVKFDGQYTEFDNVTFQGEAVFQLANFKHRASFVRAVFESSANFKNGQFNGEVDFANSKFKSTTDFTERKFSYAPIFHGCEMYVDTIWSSKKDYWPKSEAINEDPKKAERAWSTLKFHMNQVMRHDYEHMFFIKELEAKKVSPGSSISLDAYKKFSDYGRGIMRPTLWLFGFFVIFFGINLITQWTYDGVEYGFDNPITYIEFAAGVSLTDTFPLLVNSDWKPVNTPSVAVKLFSILHSLISVTLFFLIGLGLRNRFRIK